MLNQPPDGINRVTTIPSPAMTAGPPMIRLGAMAVLTGTLLVASHSAGSTTYAPTPESLDRRPLPTWFLDAKFDILIH